jgi:putative ABC transport system ATP-binding protein
MNKTAPDGVIRAEGIDKVFGEGEAAVHALAGVDLVVPPSQFLVIMGPSGSGKSTLLNILGGIETPSAGSITMEGKNLAELDDNALTLLRRRRIGFVFQAFNLLPILTAEENVAFPLVLDGVPVSQAHSQARVVLEQLGLKERLRSYPGTLSGGEQQRVAIARALVIDPLFILADEPTGNLDSATTDQIVAMLRHLVSGIQKTLIMVTHNPLIAAQADRVLVLRDGRIVADFMTAGKSADEIEPLLKGKHP